MKNLWASRHAASAPPIEGEWTEKKEILWGESLEECQSLWRKLQIEFDVVYGVFPAQAIEALNSLPAIPDFTVFSAVSRAILEPDTGKVRTFQFVRWARLH